ncbi:MAG: sigma-54 dependent transcriptional regulator [Geothermobacteraceae bacterium]
MTDEFRRILVVDDDASLGRVLQFQLGQAGYEARHVLSADDALECLRECRFDLVLTDVRLTGMTGLDLLARLRVQKPDMTVVVMTAYGTLEEAVRAIRMGAYDYLTKPFSREQLLATLAKAFGFSGMRRRDRRQRAELARQLRGSLLGDSPAMQSLHSLVRRMADADAPVLILGESGTGKELVARQLHTQSPRGEGPFVAVNCAAIPADLLESELFGHVRGAFTGATQNRAGKFVQADGGTLFLDEIGEMPPSLQPKLLRALQEKEITPVGGQTRRVDVRVVAATNRDLDAMVHDGRFREDLYYRIAVLLLRLPPLRDRVEDISLLARHFLDASERGRGLQLDHECVQALKSYPWPGNVRELQNLMERLAVMAQGEVIGVRDLPLKILACGQLRGDVVHLPPEGFPLEEIERQAILQALALCNWNQTKAAEFLRVPRHVLAYRVEKYQLLAQRSRNVDLPSPGPEERS